MAEEGQVKTDELDAQAEARRRLALAQIRQYPDPVLRLEAQQVQDFDDDLKQLVERMARLMQDARGVGLAANQVGVLRRVFVIQAEDEPEPRALVNPSIVERSEESGEDDEGCLSMQGVVVSVERPVRIRLEASDEEGKPVDARARGPSGAGRPARARPSRRRPHPRPHVAGRPSRGDGRPAAISRACEARASRRRRRSARTSSNASPTRHEIEFLLTRPDRPRGRGRKVGAPPAKETAERLGIPVRQDEKLDESFSVEVDTVVVVAYGALIPASLLDRALWLNVHPSLLPRWRGAAPIERAIMAGDDESAVSVIRLVEALDAGPIGAQRSLSDRRRHDGGRRLCGDGSPRARAHRRGSRQRLVLTPGRRADLRREDRPRRS